MEIKEFPEGWWMIKNCSQVLDYEDAVALIEEYFEIEVPVGSYLLKMTEVDEDHEEVGDLISYSIVPEKVAAAMKSHLKENQR